MSYVVKIKNNRVCDIVEVPDAEYDELGLEWALSELKDAVRNAENVDADFSLADDSELHEFLRAVTDLLGANALDRSQLANK